MRSRLRCSGLSRRWRKRISTEYSVTVCSMNFLCVKWISYLPSWVERVAQPTTRCKQELFARHLRGRPSQVDAYFGDQLLRGVSWLHLLQPANLWTR